MASKVKPFAVFFDGHPCWYGTEEEARQYRDHNQYLARVGHDVVACRVIPLPDDQEVFMSGSNFYPYPSTVSPAAFETAMQAVRGDLDVKRANHALWEVYGYASGRIDPTAPVVQEAMPPEMEKDEALRAMALMAGKSQEGMPLSAIPWLTVVKVVVRVLNKALNG